MTLDTSPYSYTPVPSDRLAGFNVSMPPNPQGNAEDILEYVMFGFSDVFSIFDLEK